MSNMRIRNMFFLVTALAVMFLLACGQSDEEIDALVEAKVTEILANMPDPTPIPEPTPITIPTPVPTATPSPPPTPMPTATPMPTPTPWGFNMTGWEAVGLVEQLELTRKFGEEPLETDIENNYMLIIFDEVTKETEGAMAGHYSQWSNKYFVIADDQLDRVLLGPNPMEALGFKFEINWNKSEVGSNYSKYVAVSDVGRLQWNTGRAGPVFETDNYNCLNMVNAINDDWRFTYNENMNTWLVEKSVLSWTVHIRTKAVVPSGEVNQYCR